MNDAKYSDRFFSRLVRSGTCLEWPSYRDRDGYGRTYPRDGERCAHRIAWSLRNGRIPRGLMVCHHCDNPACCNPDHLFLGTVMDNARDCVAKGRRPRGAQHGGAKLSDESVRSLIVLASMNFTQCELAASFGVSQSIVYRILAGKAWQHISRAHPMRQMKEQQRWQENHKRSTTSTQAAF